MVDYNEREKDDLCIIGVEVRHHMIQVKIFYANNDLRNFSYLIQDQAQGISWVIDPFDDKPISDYIKKEGLGLSGILNTHQHWDHIKGNSALQNLFNCSSMSRETGLIPLNDTHSIKFLDTPGHTMDHQAFVLMEGTRPLGLFSGDTLFNSGVGNCKSGGNVDVLFTTTEQLKNLSDEVILYPGHDYVLKNLLFAKSCEPENKDIDEALKYVREADSESGLKWNLGQEKKVNPFFRLDSEEIKDKMELDEASAIFKKLRSLRDNW